MVVFPLKADVVFFRQPKDFCHGGSFQFRWLILKIDFGFLLKGVGRCFMCISLMGAYFKLEGCGCSS